MDRGIVVVMTIHEYNAIALAVVERQLLMSQIKTSMAFAEQELINALQSAGLDPTQTYTLDKVNKTVVKV